jgi:dihydrofolate reductase
LPSDSPLVEEGALASVTRPRITLVAAVADNGVIGAGGDIPWRIPEDFAHFKRVTLGHTLVMGRATYDSIGRPLPGRTTVVLTRDPSWSADGVLVAASLEDALALATDLPGEVMVSGGAAVYAAALPLAAAQILTEVHLSPEGDTSYPYWDRSEWVETQRVPGPGLEWVWWERATPIRQQSVGVDDPLDR